ncbi:MAG: NUDIX domain-containing protein [Acidimicrobiales bacterium]
MSAGLLPYRIGADGALEVMLVHPGGPFWKHKDEHAWSVAKGECGPGEDPRDAADREFAEEVGVPAPRGRRHDLGEVRQSAGKVVRIWAVEAATLMVGHVHSNEFEVEWPPRSGVIRSFPEVDRAEWTSVEVARSRLVRAQVEYLDRLLAVLGTTPDHSPPVDRPAGDNVHDSR